MLGERDPSLRPSLNTPKMPPLSSSCLSHSINENRAAFRTAPNLAAPSRSPFLPLLKENSRHDSAELNDILRRPGRHLAERKVSSKILSLRVPSVRRREKIVLETGCSRDGLKETDERKAIGSGSKDNMSRRVISRKTSKHLVSPLDGKPSKNLVFPLDGNHKVQQISRARARPAQVSDNSWTFCHGRNQRRLPQARPGDKTSEVLNRVGRSTNVKNKSCVELSLRNQDGFLHDRFQTDAVPSFFDDFGTDDCLIDDGLVTQPTTPLKSVLLQEESALDEKRDQECTPPTDKNPTPPMQATSSPDLTKRGTRGFVPVGQGCFGAGQAMVKDRRKCKPRGVLTVDVNHEFHSSTDSEMNFRQSIQIPAPAVASVEWMVDEDTQQRTSGSSSGLTSTSSPVDICRMSFQRHSMSMAQLQSFKEEDESEVYDYMGDGEDQNQRTGLSELYANCDELFSQDMQSSFCTRASTQYQRSVSSVSMEELPAEAKYRGPSLPSLSSGGPRRNILIDKTVYDDAAETCSVGLPSYQGFLRRHFVPLLKQTTFPGSGRSIHPVCFSESMGLEEMDCSFEKLWFKSLQEGPASPKERCLPLFRCSSFPNEQHLETGVDYRSCISMAADMSFSVVEVKDTTERSGIAEEAGMKESRHTSHVALVELLYILITPYLEKTMTKGRSVCKELYVHSDRNRCSKASHQEHESGGDNSLLRGLTIDTSICEDDSSSECSVNQQTSSLQEDSVDSFVCLPRRQFSTEEESGHRSSFFPCRSFLNLGTMACAIEEDLPIKFGTVCHRVLDPRQEDEGRLPCDISTQVGTWVPSRAAAVTVGFLLIGAMVINYVNTRHLKHFKEC